MIYLFIQLIEKERAQAVVEAGREREAGSP